MATVGGILGVIVLLVIPALLAGRIARRKDRPFWLYLVAGLLLGPLALIAALVLPKRRLLT
jgi:ABC-type Mn2+/Zn2+ transport system permease subunit